MMSPESSILYQLLSEYPDGFTDQGWSSADLSLNPFLTDSIVRDNPDIKWNNRFLLGHSNLSSEFRLNILKNIDLKQYLEYELIRDMFVDLNILMASLEIIGGDEDLLYNLLQASTLSLEAVEYLHKLEYKGEIHWCIARYSEEAMGWMVYNHEVWDTDMIWALINNEHISKHPEWTDHILQNVQLDDALELICYASDAVDRLERMIKAGGYKIDSLLEYSQSPEFTRLILLNGSESYDHSRYFYLCAIDNEVALEILNDDRYKKYHSYILCNETLANDIIIEHIRGKYQTNPNPELLDKIINIYDHSKYCINYEVYSMMMDIIESYELSDDPRYIVIVYAYNLGSKGIGVYEYSPASPGLDVGDVESLALLAGTLPDYVGTLKYSGEVSQDVIDIIVSNRDIMSRMNWDKMSNNVDYEIILNNQSLPWNASILSRRSYKPQARYLYTKRAV